MFRNSEIKNLILLEVIFIIFSLIITFIVSVSINKLYENEQIENNSYLAGSLIVKYPELENDIINGLTLNDNYEEGHNLLEKYGLNKITNFNNDILKKSVGVNLVSIFACLIIIGLINYVFIKYIYYKISKIDKYMNNILNGNYSLNINEYCEGDISNLKNDTYKMTVKLREQHELLSNDKKYLEELLEDISHQIKTPLTSMYMINEILRNEKKDKIRKNFIEKNELQIKRIEWLISSLLKISRLDSGTIRLKNEKVSLNTLIDKAISPINELINEKKVKLYLNISPDKVNVDLNWTAEALLNIIKNACEHTKDIINIETKTNPIYTEIIVSDNGPGIENDDLPHIFERFYRGKNDNKESIGIGLNMSKKVINMQEGTIEVDTNSQGTTFKIKLFKNTI